MGTGSDRKVIPEHRRIGLVTVTYNSGEVLPDFFSSFEAQSYQNSVLVVVDNASKDDSIIQIRDHAGVILIANDFNAGVAAANNQGIRKALQLHCDAVLLINNDVLFGPDLISGLVEGLDQYGCEMATPLIYYASETQKVWAAGGGFQSALGLRVYHAGEGEIDHGQFSPKAISYAPTCCVLIRSSVFHKIGLMDERYFVYSDDVDFMYRASQAGQRLFLITKVKLWHKVNSLTGGATSDFSLFYGSRGRALFLRKHLGVLGGSFWNYLYIGFCWLRILAGKDTRHRGRKRIQGTMEGSHVGAANPKNLTI